MAEMATTISKYREELDRIILSSARNVQYGFAAGFLIGGYSAGQRASLQYLAEHQHELPQTRSEALQYYRNKNYRTMAAFGSGGIRKGVQLASVGLAYSGVKEILAAGRSFGKYPLPSYTDDLVAGSTVGASFFTLSSKP